MRADLSVRGSLASIHRMTSWLLVTNADITVARSSRHCWRGLVTERWLLVDAIIAACRRKDVRGPTLPRDASGTL